MLGLAGQYSFQWIHVRTDSVNMEIDDGLLAFRTFLFITLNISHHYIRDFFADNKGATLRMPSDGLIIFRESSAKDRIAFERLVSQLSHQGIPVFRKFNLYCGITASRHCLNLVAGSISGDEEGCHSLFHDRYCHLLCFGRIVPLRRRGQKCKDVCCP